MTSGQSKGPRRRLPEPRWNKVRYTSGGVGARLSNRTRCVDVVSTTNCSSNTSFGESCRTYPTTHQTGMLDLTSDHCSRIIATKPSEDPSSYPQDKPPASHRKPSGSPASIGTAAAKHSSAALLRVVHLRALDNKAANKTTTCSPCCRSNGI